MKRTWSAVLDVPLEAYEISTELRELSKMSAFPQHRSSSECDGDNEFDEFVPEKSATRSIIEDGRGKPQQVLDAIKAADEVTTHNAFVWGRESSVGIVMPIASDKGSAGGALMKSPAQVTGSGVVATAEPEPNAGESCCDVKKQSPRHRSIIYICSTPGCNRQRAIKGKCAGHGGHRVCSSPGCTKIALSRRKCFSHGGGTRCSHPGCSKKSWMKGKCQPHSTLCSHKGCRRCPVSNGKCKQHGK